MGGSRDTGYIVKVLMAHHLLRVTRTYHNISLRLSTNSEVNASDLLETIEQIFPQRNMYDDVSWPKIKYSTTR